jgi:AcrR family transcriptional regulator
MAGPRRRLSPEDRRSELLALGAEIFGSRPYDEVRIDEVAEIAGVSRALMYHYFPDKRTFFAAVVRAETERMFDAADAPSEPGRGFFARYRDGVLAYLRYDEEHPHTSWAAYLGMGRSDAALRGIEQTDNDRQADRIMATFDDAGLDPTVLRDLRVAVCGSIAFTLELARQRVIDPSIDAEQLADAAAHAILDAMLRVPGLPPEVAAAVSRGRPE